MHDDDDSMMILEAEESMEGKENDGILEQFCSFKKMVRVRSVFENLAWFG